MHILVSLLSMKRKRSSSWNLFKGEINKIGSWIKVKKTITISDNRIKFITFRLGGVGRGEFRFDNIAFSKIN